MFDKCSAKSPVFILGVQKSGTTSLFDILSEASIFSPSRVKEPGYFSKTKFYELGEDWYFRHFELDSEKFMLEATPEYLYYPYVAERIFKYNSKSKFIVILREPASRAYSAWNMFKRFNKDPMLARAIYDQFTAYADTENRNAIASLLYSETYPEFNVAVEDDIARYRDNSHFLEPSFVRRGLYLKQIEVYLKYFDRGNFLFIDQSELSDYKTLQSKLVSFFDVYFDLGQSKGKSNVGLYESVDGADFEAIERLKYFYQPHNEDLFEFLGSPFDW